MIKSITTVRVTRSKDDFAKLSALFDALGFERGKSWQDARSQGAPFLAPVGSIEFVNGKTPAEGDLLVEVSDLENARTIIEKSKLAGTKLSKIQATHWKSRYFTAELAKTIKLTFWAFDAPQKSAYQTIEGDLNSAGARFAIVVSRFNQFITERLLQGALDALHRTGTAEESIEIIRVPGAFEVPIAAREAAMTKRFDAVI